MALFFNDTFTDTNGTGLESHTPELGGPWVRKDGAANDGQIQSNRATSNSAVVNYYTTAEPGGATPADYDVEADFHWVTNDQWSSILCWRHIATETGAYHYGVRYDAGTNLRWAVRRYLDGDAAPTIVVATWSQALPTVGTTIHIKVEARGTSIKVYVDDVLRIDTTHSEFTAAGRPALSFSGSTSLTGGVHFNSMTATDLSAAGLTERLAPDTIAASTNLSGAVTDIDEDPDSPDANWLTASTATSATDVRVTFPSPSGTLIGAQNFRAQVRKTTGSPTPTIDMQLYENGSLVSTLLDDTGVTSTTGEVVQGNWTAADVTNAANVECRIVATAGTTQSTTTERQAPNTLLNQTGLTGALTSIDEDPDSPDGLWLTTTNNTSTICRVGFPILSAALATGAGLQQFKAWVRKTNHATNPTANLELYENGSLVSTLQSGVTISSTSGQMLTGTWDATGRTAADIECRVTGTPGGGNPGDRASVEVGAIEWNAEIVSGTTPVNTVEIGAIEWNVTYEEAAGNSATAASVAPSATQSASATFAPGTSTATGASVAPSVSQAAVATHVPPAFTATGASTSPSATQVAAAAFAGPAYDAVGASVAPAAVQEAAAAFLPPVFSASAASALSAASQAATATFSPPVFTATAASVAGSAFAAASASYDPGTFTASAAQTSPAATQAGTVVHVPPSFTATGASVAPGAAQAATGTVSEPQYDAVGVSVAPSSVSDATATFVPPPFTAAAVSVAPVAGQAVAATFVPPAFTATAASGLPSLVQAATATHGSTPIAVFEVDVFEVGVFVGGGAVGASVLASMAQAATATHTAPVFTGSGASTAPVSAVNATATHAPPVYTATAASAIGAISQAASASYAPPDRTATSAQTASAATQAAAATHVGPGGSVGQAASAIGGATQSATATVEPPVFSASAASVAPAAGQAATAAIEPPVFSAAVLSALSAAVQAASATAAPPVFSATGASAAAAAVGAATAAHVPPGVSATGASIAPSVSQSATAAHNTSRTASVVAILPSLVQSASATFAGGAPPAIARTRVSGLTRTGLGLRRL